MNAAAGVVTALELRDADVAMKIRLRDGLAVGGEKGGALFRPVARESDEFLPLPETHETVAETLTSVLPAAAVGIVIRFFALLFELREARQGDHVPREIDRAIELAEAVEVADEPLVVVGEVVDLIGNDAVAHHVGMVDPG